LRPPSPKEKKLQKLKKKRFTACYIMGALINHMLQPLPKKNKRYIWYRWYVAIVFTFAPFAFIYWIITCVSGGPSTLAIATISVFFPLFFIAIVILLSIFAFNFEYSMLGNLQRTSFPDTNPIYKTNTWGQIGPSRVSVMTFYVYPSGLGIEIMFLGKVYIPKEYFNSIKTQGVNFMQGRYELNTASPEVSGPIDFMDKKLFENLQAIMPK
jgi:hypothetical protein